MKKLFLGFLILCGSSVSANAQTTIVGVDGVAVQINDISRIITVGGSISETVWALGEGNKVIATDVSTTYPPEVFRLPRVPYVRSLTPEGILSLNPTLILASDEADPQAAIDQLRDAGASLLIIRDDESLEGVIEKISTIGDALGLEGKAEELIRQNQAKYDEAEQKRASLNDAPKVMFVLAVNNGSSFMVAGTNTGAEEMIKLAGGSNVFDSFEGYKPVSNEAILAANPDFVLVMESRKEEVALAIKNTSGVNLITAAINDQIIGMDGNFLLGFGPRFGEAILVLMSQIHPEEVAD